MDDETNRLKLSTQTPPPPARRGCGWALLYGGLFSLLVMIGVGGVILWQSYRSVNEGLVKPMEALVRGLGLQATPEVRPDPVTVLKSMRDLAQLQTAEFNMEKIITAKKGEESLFGLFSDSLIFVAVGKVTAGVDLGKLTEGDIRVTSFQTATLRLPSAELFIATLDNSKSYVANRDTGLLASADPNMETMARQAGESAIREAALEGGILEIADENAKMVLEGLLKSLGFAHVIFVDGEMPPPENINPEGPPKGFIIDLDQ